MQICKASINLSVHRYEAQSILTGRQVLVIALIHVEVGLQDVHRLLVQVLVGVVLCSRQGMARMSTDCGVTLQASRFVRLS